MAGAGTGPGRGSGADIGAASVGGTDGDTDRGAGTGPDLPVHPAWLPPEAFAALGSRRVLVLGRGSLVDTVAREAAQACSRFGGTAVHRPQPRSRAGTRLRDGGTADLVLALREGPGPEWFPDGGTGAEGFALSRADGVTTVLADRPAGLLYGLFHVVRLGEGAFTADQGPQLHRPVAPHRILDHWDNVDVHPVMGQVERGYSGGSLFWQAGRARREPVERQRIRDYARLLAGCGVNGVTVNNVNVHPTEERLLTDRLGDLAELADLFRPYGIRVHLAVGFAAPLRVGGLPTADPRDGAVRRWWARVTDEVYAAVRDFGGYLVKADSEGRPGPSAYGRDHAEGAGVLAEALAPHGGVVRWRAFVYDHRQDWRDRSTDRARAAHDRFTPLDGRFAEGVVLQVKHGPMDFQVREPVSPLLAAMPQTALAVELQVTQEYTGQQRHVCYLAEPWSEVLGFLPWGADGARVADVAARGGGLVGVSNAGDDPFWTGHPLAQANLYAFGRLAWDPALPPAAVLDEWIDLTFTPDRTADPALVRRTLHALLDGSARTYEQYTAPLGVGFMVNPGDHYGPAVDGYEYSPWGTYHFADRDGVGVDRTRATGTGFTGQYPPPWRDRYESLRDCPDELLLFFHHVPYGHVLHSGSTVIQHIYDTHVEGARRVEAMERTWRDSGIAELIDPAVHARVAQRLAEQVRAAREWRDQITTYFLRKSGIPDPGDRIFP